MVDEAVERARLRERETAASLAGLQKNHDRLLGRLAFLEKNAEGGGGGGGGLSLGMIVAWGGDENAPIPANCLELNGQTVSAATFSGLAGVYASWVQGADLIVPDLSGHTIAGYEAGDPYFGTLGDFAGEAEHTLIVAEMPSHRHDSNAHVYVSNASYSSSRPLAAAHSSSASGAGGSVSNFVLAEGGGDAHANVQPTYVGRWIVVAADSSGEYSPTVQASLVASVTARDAAIDRLSGAITEVQIDTVSRSSGTSWTYGPAFAEITGFKAGSRVHLDFNVPMRNRSNSWGGLYFEPQIRFDLGTWQSLGSSGYDMMNTGAQAIQTYNGAILVDPGISAVFSIQIRYLFKAYDTSVELNGSHDINKVSGTATIMAGDNGDQFYTKFIIKEILA